MMRLICLTIATAAYLSTAAYGAGVSVAVRPQVDVAPGSTIVVSDIAHVQGGVEAAKKVGEISLGVAPSAGQERTIASSYIQSRLNSANVDGGVALVGPEKITVRGECDLHTSDELSERAVEFVRSKLPDENWTCEVSVTRPPRDLAAPKTGSVELRPRLYGNAVRPGSNTVILVLVDKGRTIATTNATVSVAVVADVLVASDSIRSGDPVDESNTVIERRDITRVGSPMLADGLNSAGDWIARGTIGAGEVIEASDVKRAPVVKRGDVVSLVVTCGRVTLHTTAEVKEDGGVGEMVRARPAVSDQDVQAQVVESGMLAITR